ncbi:TetR/AcrR family transcriptional regulator [Streptodolium elevatio]|uniref:TetR/AcrR family transcriptional regulator C-terminal domain-containing protein n=1 Tax=Streptodolium elevatio TaxID=3157996 RepID=A0ABV3DH20_9ACTN
MPRPRSLTNPQIAAAALRVLDRDGLDGLTMRAVATELGMGTMSVYRYVADRAQLEALVVDHVLAGVDTTVPAAEPRGRQVAVLAERVRTVVGAHTAVVPLILAHRHTSPASMRWGDAVLGVLADAGLGPARRVVAFRALLAYVFGALQVEHFSPLAGPGTAALAELDPADHPHLASTAREAQGIGPDEEFRGGLEILLRGLEL